MNSKLTRILFIALGVLVGAIITGSLLAGSLEPSAPPGPTMHTLGTNAAVVGPDLTGGGAVCARDAHCGHSSGGSRVGQHDRPGVGAITAAGFGNVGFCAI